MAILFSDLIIHRDVADCMRLHGPVTGAGFVEIRDGEVVTYGRSESLNIGPGKDDVKAIKRVLCWA